MVARSSYLLLILLTPMMMIIARSLSVGSTAPQAVAGVDAQRPWWEAMSLNLSKLFFGPAGTVTRIHQDAGEEPPHQTLLHSSPPRAGASARGALPLLARCCCVSGTPFPRRAQQLPASGPGRRKRSGEGGKLIELWLPAT